MSKQEQPTPRLRPGPVVTRRSSLLFADRDGSSEPSEGKVKEIMNKFQRRESRDLEELAANGYSELPICKKPPAVKPKPGRLGQSNVPQQAPPLPRKRSRFLPKKEAIVGGVEPKDPDGKEVEAQVAGGGVAEAEHNGEAAVPFCSNQSCGCLCHVQRPGMMLIWVPVDVEAAEKKKKGVPEKKQTPKEAKGRKKDKEVDGGGDGDSKAKDEADAAPVKEKPLTKQIKPDFQEHLESLFASQHRPAEPGTHATSNHYQPSLVPLKPAPSPAAAPEPPPQDDEEENIYEVNLPGVELFPKKTLAVSDVLKFSESNDLKPRGQPDAPGAASNAAPAAVEPGPSPGDVPPARPPKTPKATSTPAPSRPPPPPPPAPATLPKKDLRRPSDGSVNSLKTGEENGKNEEKEAKDPRVFALRTHLHNEPLYQMYRKTVITKEIRRQTVNRNISKTSADFPTEWTARRKGSDASAFSDDGNSSTLWQQLPEVRDSGVLERLSAEELKYQESMFEVLTSEASYLRSLRILTEHFLENRELNETLVIRDRKTLFSNILRIREVSERFLKDLDDHIYKDVVFSDICGIIHYHSQHNFPAYIDYVRNQIYQEKTFSELKKNNVQFATVIKHLQESPQCQRLPFVSFLLLPFQRITRIKMLIENILKRTKQGTKEEQEASKALDSVSKIIDKCNTEVGKMRQVEELVHLFHTLDFDGKVKAIPIISETRYLEKKGELQEMSRGKTIVSTRIKFSPVNLFLFNDLLIITAKKSGERFMVVDYAHRSLVQVQPIDEVSSITCENCFNLVMLENCQGREIERLLKAPSQADLHRWLAAFPDSAIQDDEERIYEEYDCPQVQCVEQYVAEQADELNLEPTDIINIIRKTNEGWYEGSRLSDGQRGWFPVANVIEITNEHVRRRNLLERYRVTQAASMLSKTR
ncbi:ephexin-1 isoform X2 [Kryptolebias marmoratus]|uniref:Rho guanine nucleotide exchange factor 15b n=1 Tax=Kryptolebias marmoratus TaxID=37003 RepID=A0A3Q3AYY2_KRYMA|nr:ephexin-1 isoform X2 [Kryptolebias marmoratus]